MGSTPCPEDGGLDPLLAIGMVDNGILCPKSKLDPSFVIGTAVSI